MSEGDAESRTEMSEQPLRMMNGIHQELGTERQAVTAIEDKTGPRIDKLMVEVLRRENLFGMGPPEPRSETTASSSPQI